MKGMKWESPRGPISIDPDTRDIVQNIYIRKVEKVDGELYNVEFATFERRFGEGRARIQRRTTAKRWRSELSATSCPGEREARLRRASLKPPRRSK